MTRILVVDDEWELAETLKIILELEGFTVTTAANGLEALATVAANPPHLVLSDVMMPAMTGTELAQALRTNPASAGIPIVLMSAVSLDPESNPADVFLPKPFTVDQALRVIRGALPR